MAPLLRFSFIIYPLVDLFLISDRISLNKQRGNEVRNIGNITFIIVFNILYYLSRYGGSRK